VTEAVLDASVVLKWFRTKGERHWQVARAVRKEFEAGEALVFAPPLLFIEILNVAGRRWRLTSAQLERLAGALASLGFDLVEPDLLAVARWTAQGLTAYDAAYVAVAEQTGAQLITDDDEIVRVAPQLTMSLRATIDPA
jgi:predicted nucleic acid-binding protein